MDRLRRWILGSHLSPLELIVGPEEHARELWRGGMMWFSVIVATTGVAVVLPGPDVPGLHLGAVRAVVGFGVAMIVFVSLAGREWSANNFVVFVLLLGPVFLLGVWLAGPSFGLSAAVIPASTSAVIVFHRRRAAILVGIELLTIYGIILALADGYPRPVARWILIAGFSGGSSLLMEWVFRQIKVLADRDRANAAELEVAHRQLADANRLLESRVTDQVDEIERLGRLRRFLSPQVADTVMSTGGDELLTTHRRQIAVVFVDLRGFTAFSAVAEPEDVVDVLSEFYAAVGVIVKRLEATVGAFAGDGVMAYFNDPVPCDDPAGRALDMATSLRLPMSDLGERWSRRGFNIGYGVGIAYGYATLGTIGFEERSDYTPLGSVVNLSSRLCDEAGNGEILLDGRAHEAVHEQVHAEAVRLELKGFSGVVTVYRVQVG